MVGHFGEERLVQIVGQIYDAAFCDDLWNGVLSEVEDFLNSNNLHLLVSDKSTGQPVFGVTSHYPESNVEYVNEYVGHDERWPRVLQLPHGRPTRQQGLFTEQEFRSSRFYHEFLGKYDAQSQTVTRMDGPQGNDVVLAVIRDNSAGAYEDFEINRTCLLLPHLLRTIQVRQTLVAAKAHSRPLDELLDCMNLAVVFLDRFGRVLQCNDSAEQILKMDDGIGVDDGRLKLSRIHDRATFQNLVDDALVQGLGEASGSGGVMAVVRPSLATPLAILVIPICAPMMDFGARRPVAAVFIKDPAENAGLSAQQFVSLYGFTQAESRLAAALATGYTVADYAQQQTVSINTVRTHLKAVMAKTETSSQADLVRLLLSGSLPLPNGNKKT